jgi:hypothetical protein
LIEQVYRCTKPGGYFELAEMEFKTFSDDDTQGENFKRWTNLLAQSCAKIGRPTVDATRVKEILEKGGFEDVQVTTLKQPFGPWAKDERMKKIGAMTMFSSDSGTTGYGLALFTRVLGMSPEEALTICKKATADCRNKNYHVWTPL